MIANVNKFNPDVTITLNKVEASNSKLLTALFVLFQHPEYAKEKRMIEDALEGIAVLLNNLPEPQDYNYGSLDNLETELVALLSKRRVDKLLDENYRVLIQTTKLYPNINCLPAPNKDEVVICTNPKGKQVEINLLKDSALDMMKKLDSIK